MKYQDLSDYAQEELEGILGGAINVYGDYIK